MIYRNCEFNQKNVSDVIRELESSIENKIPYSLIRLGDGEGALLSICKDSAIADIDYFSLHFNPSFISLGNLLNLKEGLISAIDTADCLGVRDDIVNVNFGRFLYRSSEFLDDFRKRFRLRAVEKSIGMEGAWRIYSLYKFCSSHDFKCNCFTTAWIHYSSALVEFIRKHLFACASIGLISSSKELKDKIATKYCVRVNHIYVPNAHQNSSDHCFANSHYNSYFHSVEENLSEIRPGEVVLVAAGILGKLYCHKIKKSGGVAIDIGSLADILVGKITRPLVIKNIYGVDFDHNAVIKQYNIFE